MMFQSLIKFMVQRGLMMPVLLALFMGVVGSLPTTPALAVWPDEPKPGDEKKDEAKPAESPKPAPPVEPDAGKRPEDGVVDDAIKRAEDQLKKSKDSTRKTKPAAKTPPAKSPASNKSAPGRIDGSNPSGNETAGAAPAEPGPSLEINIPPADPNQNAVPPEERMYSFSLKDVSYEQLLEAVGRNTGLGITGDAPKDGRTTFVTEEVVSFQEMLNRVRMLLFAYKPHEPYWIKYKKDHLEVMRVNDIYRFLDREQIFPTLEAYRAANLPKEELALLIYTPKTGSIADLREVRNFLPDYVRVSPREGQNSLMIFALVRDIDKYLELVDLFSTESEEPREFKIFKVEHIPASEAVARLQTMMELDKPKGGAAPAPRAGGRGAEPNPLDNIPEPEVLLMPDDNLHRILVRAMKDKIKEIDFYLPLIDVAPEDATYEPVVIEVRHADCVELTSTIQQILTASPEAGGAPAAPKATKKKAKGAAAAGTVQPATPVTSSKVEDITLIPQPTRNAIIVLADPDGLERVRHLVAMFDVETEVGPIRIPVQHLAASEVAVAVTNVIGGDAAQGGGVEFQLVADRSEDFVWFKGSEKDLAQVREMVALFDVPEPHASVHIANLQYQKASFVAQMLRALESSDPGNAGLTVPNSTPTAPAATKKASRKAKPVVRVSDPSKFTPDDEANRIYILCTEDEWAHYSKIIEDLESAAKSQDPVFVKLPLKHMRPDAAIEKLSPLITPSDITSQIRYAAAEGGIMVIGATPTQVGELRTLLEELDRAVEIVERTFEIRYADPADVESLLTTLLSEQNSSRELRPARPKRSQKSEENAPVVIEASVAETQGLTIARLGNRLVVRTSPSLMERVASLIAQFDVESGVTEVRTYTDFAPTADLDDIANTLSSVFGSGPLPKSKKAKAETAEGPRFIPQPAAGKIVVIAEKSEYPKIDEMIDILRSGSVESDPIMTRSVDLKHREASDLLVQLEPLLALKVRQLQVAGQLSEAPLEGASTPDAKSKKKPRTSVGRIDSERYHLEADDRARRIIIAGPKLIIDEAVLLIGELDTPPLAEDDTVFKTVPLKNADASEMVQAIRDLMGAAPGAKAPRKSGKKDGATSASIDLSDTPLMITEVPGGKSLVLNGPKKDVEQATRWIEDLDNQSIPGRIIKVYDVAYADINRLADLIMAVADIPEKGAAGGAKPKSKGKSGSSDEEESDEEDEFEVVKERVGSEVYIQTDLLSKTMIVAASQTKFAQIDPIVARFNKAPDEAGGSELSAKDSTPKFIYELKHKDAFDAVWDLEALLEGVWEPANELPKVKEAGFGDAIIIKYPYENRFDEIRELIAKWVDKPSKVDMELKRKVIVPPGEMSPKAAAEWLKVHFPNMEIEIDMPSEQKQEDFGVEQIKPTKQVSAVKPCVLPTAFGRAMGVVGAVSFFQPEEEEEQPEPLPDLQTQMLLNAAMQAELEQGGRGNNEKSDGDKSGDSKKSKSSASGKVKIHVDPDKGVLVVEAPSSVLEDIDDGMDDLEEEIKDLPEKPDIRIYRVRYIDVYTAEEIINEIFNASRQQQAANQAQQAMMARLQQQQAMQAMRQGAQGGNQPGGPNAGKGQENPNAPGGRGAQQQPGQQFPPGLGMLMGAQQAPTSVRVFANPRDRSLILRASTSQYPEILELLATIDQPKPIDSEMKVFALEKLNAVEVEGILKEMLGLEQATSTGRRRGAGAAAAGVPGGSSGGGSTDSSLPRRLEASPVTGVLPLTVDPKDIRMSSNEDTNSILVMAPKEAIQYIGDLISQLENQDIPERETKHYALMYADVTEVIDYLVNQFADAKSTVRGGRTNRKAASAEAAAASAAGQGSGFNAPTFVAYARLNLLSVQATAEQIKEVDALIVTLDVRAPEEEWETVALAHADAKSVADTLTAMFGGAAAGGAERRAKGAGSAAGPKFIGDDGGRFLFYSAPKSLAEPILDAVAKLEEQSKGSDTVRVIELTHALPSDVADAIDSAYGSKRSGGSAKSGRSGSTSAAGPRFSVTANDAAKRLFVVADDDMFSKVESLAKSLDQPRQIGFTMRIFPLKYANARGIYTQMTKLVTDYMRMLGPAGKTVEPFSVDVDDRANALIVVGGPVVFGFVEESLKIVDVAGNANPIGFFMTVLKNGDATEVAGNITRLWQQKTAGQGETPPTVEANRATNAIIVRGTQSQLDEIKKQVIDPLEQHAQQLTTSTIILTHANPEVVADSIKRIFDDKKATQASMGKTIAPAELAVAVTPDVNTNQIIVQASEANMAMIKERVAQLDKPEIAGSSVTTTKTHTLKFADPNTVANIIREWARGRTTTGPGGKIAPRDQVTALAEPVTQSVVVTANDANHKLIGEIIRDVDADKGMSETHVVNLKNADAEGVSRTLNDIFVRAGTRPGGQAMLSISAVPGSRSLLVKCKTEDWQRIQEVVQELDREDAAAGEEVRVVPILYGDATEMQTALQAYLAKPGQTGGRGTSLVGDVRLSVLTQGNAVVISGDKSEVDRLEQTVKQLDTATEKGSVPQIIPLKYARATQLLSSVQEVFESPPGGQRRNQAPPVIVADETLNAFVVRAGPTDFAAIKGMVAQLDTEEQASRKPFTIIKVAAGMNLNKLAEDVEAAVNQNAQAEATTAGRSGRQVPEVTITPNTQTRSLLVSGTPTLFRQAEDIVRALEEMGPPAGEVTTAVFKTTNLTPEEVQAVIDTLTEQGTAGTRPNRPQGGAARPPTPSRPRRTGGR